MITTCKIFNLVAMFAKKKCLKKRCNYSNVINKRHGNQYEVTAVKVANIEVSLTCVNEHKFGWQKQRKSRVGSGDI